MENLQPIPDRPSVDGGSKLNVCKRQCDRCLFGPNPHVPWLPVGRAKIQEVLKNLESGIPEGAAFNCHEWHNVMCNGFWTRHAAHSWYGRLALGLDQINWVTP